MGVRDSIELTHDNPQHWISWEELRAGHFLIQTFWAGGGDLDQIVGFRASGSICGVVTSSDGRLGSLTGYPFMHQVNDDRTGGVGESVRGDLRQVATFMRRICVGVYNNDTRRPLRGSLKPISAVTFPGYRPIMTYAPDLRTSACSMLRIDFSQNGVEVLHDFVEVPASEWPSPLEAMTANWNNALWGRDK